MVLAVSAAGPQRTQVCSVRNFLQVNIVAFIFSLSLLFPIIYFFSFFSQLHSYGPFWLIILSFSQSSSIPSFLTPFLLASPYYLFQVSSPLFVTFFRDQSQQSMIVWSFVRQASLSFSSMLQAKLFSLHPGTICRRHGLQDSELSFFSFASP